MDDKLQPLGMTRCKIKVAVTCKNASYVLIPKPKEGKEYNLSESDVTINNQNAGKKRVTGPLYCCINCVEHMKKHSEYVSTDDIIGFVSKKKHDKYRKWKSINTNFQRDGYVVWRCNDFKLLLDDLRLSTGEHYLGEFLNMLENFDVETLFTVKVKGTSDPKIPLDAVNKRQW